MKYNIDIVSEHSSAARKADLKWDCQCKDCAAFHIESRRKTARKKEARRHVELLIKIMCLRHTNSLFDRKTELAATQLEFERIMIRKLGLADLDCAQWYGFKKKVPKISKVAAPNPPQAAAAGPENTAALQERVAA